MLTDESLLAAVDAYNTHGNQRAAALALGIAQSSLHKRLSRAAERGLMGPQKTLPGYAIASLTQKTADGSYVKQTKAPGEVFKMPEGLGLHGVTAFVDAEGRIKHQHIMGRKDARGPSAVDIAETLKAAFADYKPAAVSTLAPDSVQDDLLTLLPLADLHMGLYAWKGETGQNWDLRIAEETIGKAIDDVVARSPASGHAIVLGGGDLVHSDSNENKTARSGNALQVDGRYQKVLLTACHLIVRAVEANLCRHQHVTVRILPGNHDEHASVGVAYFLLAWFRNEPRVTVDVDPSLFFWFRFGKVLLGATHGHTVKMADMPSIMAHRRAEDWGATTHRRIHTFHVHHSSKIATEGNGVICESHQTPTPQDAWHFGAGYLSGRSMQTITYHQNYGEVSRVRVAMMDGAQVPANDNYKLAVAA